MLLFYMLDANLRDKIYIWFSDAHMLCRDHQSSRTIQFPTCKQHNGAYARVVQTQHVHMQYLFGLGFTLFLWLE